MTLAAIATVVTVAEILKNSGFAVEKSEIIFPLFPFPFSPYFLPYSSVSNMQLCGLLYRDQDTYCRYER